MKYEHPHKDILAKTGQHWDHDETDASVRWAFTRASQCRTAELGAEVYRSENEEKLCFHTCKSRSCSSCGYRATVQWQRERWAALPDVPYKGITFTMPDVLWPLFHDNRRLLRALSAFAAEVIQARVGARHGVRVGVIAILHTFNGKLEFNSHVHTMVTGGGLYGTSGTWKAHVYYDRNRMMQTWRNAVIALVRAAVVAGQLRTNMSLDELEAMLAEQEKRWWSIKIQSFKSKEHFLRYAARYLRRPPIAQRRITHIDDSSVEFWYTDKKLRRREYVHCSPEEFIDRWAQHVPERYQNGVRSFGLFAPRSLRQTSPAIFAMLGQKRRPRPKPRPWAASLMKDFGKDPLLDRAGNKMKWAGRLAPTLP